MLKKIVIGIICLAAIAAIVLYVNQNAVVFNGSRVKNPDSYTIEFTVMNQEDTHAFQLHEGDSLLVEFGVNKGRLDLSIRSDDGENVYTGQDVRESSFQLTIPKDGTYNILVSAKHASGFVTIRLKETTTDVNGESAD